MKIRPVGAELFHADGQTDMTKLTIAFRNFAKTPKFFLFCPENSLLVSYRSRNKRRLFAF